MISSRATAALVLSNLMDNRGSLASELEPCRPLEEFQLVQELCFGCCRWFHLLQFFIACLISKPLKKKDHDVLALVIIGLYQLREMRIPDHAAINETVAAVDDLKKPWAKALINGVLRNFLRQQQELETRAKNQHLAVRTSHPQWLVDCLESQWPGQYKQLLAANNQRPPMTLRVNLSRLSRPDYSARLTAAGLEHWPGELADSALYLHQPVPVQALPGFAEGLISVQDEASQLVSSMLDTAPGQRILDACAAPGGKTCHLLESECSLTEIVAIDRNPARLRRLEENLQRLQLEATVKQADVAEVEQWWDGTAFDRILLDAPCSATGVIRRHPDIKLLRSPDAIDRLQQQQIDLLQSLWCCLAPGGLLLYTSCSVLSDENSDVIARFSGVNSDAKYEGVTADWGVECSYGRQLLPLEQNGPDGFFYSLLRKNQGPWDQSRLDRIAMPS